MKTLRASRAAALTLALAVFGCGGGGGGSPATVTDFCAKWAQNVCQISTSCGITPTSCITYQTSQCNAFATAATADGKRVFTPNNMNGCLDKLKTAYTGVGVITPAQMTAIDTACNYVFQGKVAQLGPETCVSQYDCAGATDGSIICDPTQHFCAKKMTVASGAQCQGVGYVCPQDSYCAPNAGGVPVCTAEANMGESCATIPCGHGTRCVNNTCVVLAQAGEACSVDADCGASSAPYCNHYAASPICSAGLQFATGSPSCACVGQGMSCPTQGTTGAGGQAAGGAGGKATGAAGGPGGAGGKATGAAGGPGGAGGAAGGTAGAAGGAAGSAGGTAGAAAGSSGAAGQGGAGGAVSDTGA